MDFKIIFEKPKVYIETNDCIDVVDNSVVFSSVEKMVKEVTEYSILSEQPQTTEFDFESAQIAEVLPKDAEVVVVTEYVPVNSATIEKIKFENTDQMKPIDEKVNVPDVNVTEKTTIDDEKDECKIEDVSNLEIQQEYEESTEPIISHFREEKIIKINVENDEIQITEFKSDSEENLEEEKEMTMQVDTGEIEEGNIC